MNKNFLGQIASYMIDRYRVVYLLIALVTILGVVSYTQLPKEVMPELKFPYVSVEITYNGAAPEDVEKLITNKVETAVKSVGDIVKLTSESAQGYSYVEIKFRSGVNIAEKINKVKTEVDQIKDEMPSGIDNPIVSEFSIGKMPVLILNLSGNYQPHEVTEIAKELRNKFRSVDGVNKVNLYGERKQEIAIHIDPAKMSQYAIDADTITSALKSRNTDIPAGLKELSGQIYTLRIKNTYSEVNEIENTLIKMVNDYPIYLKDVATVTKQNVPLENYSITPVNFKMENEVFKTVTSLQIIKEKGTDTIRVNDEIRAIVEEEKGYLIPEDLKTEFVSDMSEHIKKSQKDVFGSAFSGLLVVIIVLFFFIDLKESMIVASVIPISLLVSTSLFKYFGVTFNILSMMGLIIALGMLVDNAIVVIESFDDVKRKHNNTVDAAKEGTSKIAAAVFASTVTTVIAFLPLAMMKGDLGQIFKPIPVAAVLALIASFFVSIMVTPVFASKFLSLKHHIGGADKPVKKYFLIAMTVVLGLYGFADNGKFTLVSYIGAAVSGLAIYYKLFKIKGSIHESKPILKYEAWISTTLKSKKRRLQAIGIALILFVGAVGLLMSDLIKKEAFAETDTTSLTINMELKSGSTLDETEAIVMKVHDIVKSKPYVKSYSAIIGSDGRHKGRVQLVLVHKKERDIHSRNIKLELAKELKALTGAKFSVSGGDDEGAQLTIQLKGGDKDRIKETSENLISVLRSMSGVEDAWTNASNGTPQMMVEFDHQKATALGVDIGNAGMVVRQAITGEKISTFVKNNKETNIMLRSTREGFEKINDLSKIHFTSERGSKVPFDSISKASIREGTSMIEHIDAKKVTKLYVLIGKGETAGSIVSSLNEAISSNPDLVSPKVSLDFGGDYDNMQKSFKDLSIKMLIVMVLIYTVLVIQFDSYMQPFVILLAVPLAVIGVAGGHVMVNINFGVMSFMGIVSLAGIAVNDSIVLIDTINQMRKFEGMNMIESIIKAGKSRFVPVIATSVTTIGGVLPLALYNEDYSQMAYTLIFGLLSSTVLILVVIPLIMHQLELNHEKMSKFLRKRRSNNETA